MEFEPENLDATKLICTHCRSPLVVNSDSDWLSKMTAGELTETSPIRPAGAAATSPSAGLVCSNDDCQRVFLVWDGIPNMLAQEAGILLPSGERGA